MSTDSIRRAARTALETGGKPRGTETFLDREEANHLTVAAATGQGGRSTPVTAGEVQVLADLFDRRHVVRNTPYQGPSTTQSPVPDGAVAMDVGAEERLWVFLQRHNAPVAELKPVIHERVMGTLRVVRLAPGSTTAPSLSGLMPFALEDGPQSPVAHVHPQRRTFILERPQGDGTSQWWGPLPMASAALPRFEDASRLPQFRAERAVQNLVGVDVDLSGATFRRHQGELTVTFNLPGASFRVTPDNDATTGADVLTRIIVREQKPLFSKSEARTINGHLADANHAGTVAAIGTSSQTRGASNTTMVTVDRHRYSAITLTTAPSGTATVQPFAWNEDEARGLAVTLVRSAALAIAENIGPAGILEVYARLQNLQPSTLQTVGNDDSPVGVGTNEIQFAVPNVLGDIAAYVTFDKQTAAVRVETFN